MQNIHIQSAKPGNFPATYKLDFKWLHKCHIPANICLFKVAIETLEKGVKYVQS